MAVIAYEFEAKRFHNAEGDFKFLFSRLRLVAHQTTALTQKGRGQLEQ